MLMTMISDDRKKKSETAEYNSDYSRTAAKYRKDTADKSNNLAGIYAGLFGSLCIGAVKLGLLICLGI